MEVLGVIITLLVMISRMKVYFRRFIWVKFVFVTFIYFFKKRIKYYRSNNGVILHSLYWCVKC
jgi:hypothetical protein